MGLETRAQQRSGDSAYDLDFVPESRDGDDDVASFLDTTTTKELLEHEEMPFSRMPTRSRRPPRLSGLTAPASSSTCQALSLVVFALLLACALLSHYFTTTTTTTTTTGITSSIDELLLPPPPPPRFTTTAMTISEKQALLKAYLGESAEDGSSMNMGVKLPAGGNPIDLIRLLHSSRASSARSNPETIVLQPEE